MLSKLQCADAKTLQNDKPVWVSLVPKDALPAILRPIQECQNLADENDDLEWPIRLEFYTLPLGWELIGKVPSAVTPHPLGVPDEPEKQDHWDKDSSANTSAGQFSWYDIDALIGSNQNVELQFQKETQVVVMRSTMCLRHEHMWEKELKPTRLDDYKMLVDWGLTSRLTPAQLAFAFKKLADHLKGELQAFVGVQDVFERILLAKARKYVEIEHEIDFKTKAGEMRQVEQLTNTLKVYSQEFSTLCDGAPLHFLIRMQAACQKEQDDIDDVGVLALGGHKMSTRTMSVKDKDTKSADATNIADSQALAPIGRRPLQTRLNMSGAKPASVAPRTLREKLERELHEKMSNSVGSSGGKSQASVRSKTGQGAAPIDESEVLNKIAVKIDEHLDRLRSDGTSEGAPGLRGRQKKAQKDVSQTAKDAKSDGRMTFNEFQKVMFGAGISWLNEDEMRSKFEAMDLDNSGRLNLAEVFSAATRMQQLVERARDYEKQERGKGRVLSQVEVMEEFSMLLLTGENLARVPSAKITVSSGQQTQQFLAVDCPDNAWVAQGPGIDEWIQWDFGTPCNVTTVSTAGHPELNNWVTHFVLWFWEERRHDPEVNEAVTFHEMKRRKYRTAKEKEKGALYAKWQGFELCSNAADAEAGFAADPSLGPGKWVRAHSDSTGDQTVFHANIDHNSIVECLLDPPIEATLVRLQVKAFHGKQAMMRADILGYPLDDDDEAVTGTGEAPEPSRPQMHQRGRAGSVPGSVVASVRATPRGSAHIEADFASGKVGPSQ